MLTSTLTEGLNPSIPVSMDMNIPDDEGAKYSVNCGWMLKDQKLSAWLLRKPEMPFLWLVGRPGSGKSVICSQLIKFIQANHSVVRHFCTYAYISSTKYEAIIKSLLIQLLNKTPDLVIHVYHEYVLGKKAPALSTLEHLLQMITFNISSEPRDTEYVWIILDGADECEPAPALLYHGDDAASPPLKASFPSTIQGQADKYTRRQVDK